MASDPLPGSCEQLSSQPDPSWERLLHEARQGEARALNELIETWKTYLFHVAETEISDDLRRKVGVSDLVQSACLDIYLRFPDFRGDSVEQWRQWLRRLMQRDLQDARRRFVDAQRRDLRRERSLQADDQAPREPSDHDRSPRASLIAKEETAALQAAMLQLPEDYRTVLRLRNWECLSFVEIGKQLNRSEDAVRKLWSRAILRLQQEFHDASG